ERLATLDLAHAELASWEDVDDPAGGDLPVFRACAREIRDLVDRLVPPLRPQAIAPAEIAEATCATPPRARRARRGGGASPRALAGRSSRTTPACVARPTARARRRGSP